MRCRSSVQMPALNFGVLGLLVCVAGSATPARAASFDCAKARQVDEIAICGTPDLSERDTEMAALWFAWRSVPMLMGGSGARRDEAVEFLQRRAACGGDVACLRQAYRDRIAALRGDIGRAMADLRRQGDAAASPVLPGPVAAIVAGYANQCQQLGGTLEARQPTVMTGDIDDDGKPDYVLDPQNLRCSAAATAFCGNGGCRISVALSSDDYAKPLEVLGGQPTLSQRRDDARLDVWVDKTNCGAPNGDSTCWASYSWTDNRLDRTYRTRSRSDVE